MSNYNYKPYTEKIVESSYLTKIPTTETNNITCLICLDDNAQELFHFLDLTHNCSCNFHIHKSCLLRLIDSNRPNKCVCPLCYTPITNTNNIATYNSIQTTEYQLNNDTHIYSDNNNNTNFPVEEIRETGLFRNSIVDSNNNNRINHYDIDVNTGIYNHRQNNTLYDRCNNRCNYRYCKLDICCGLLCVFIMLFGLIISFSVVFGVIYMK